MMEGTAINISHSGVVKNKLGKVAIDVLNALLETSTGAPPAVRANRFRADHPEWIDTLDILHHNANLIERTADGSGYIVRSYVLPLIDSDKAKRLLHIMHLLFIRLKELYPIYLDEPIDIELLIDGINDDRNIVIDALYYLSETHDIWSGKNIDFPYASTNSLTISESVLRHDNLSELLSKYYEWHYINPSKQVSNTDALYQSLPIDARIGFLSHDKQLPDWYEKLDEVKKALVKEIDAAIENNLSALPTIGLRTLIETIIVENVGDNGDGFYGKLQRFEERGFATTRQINLLHSVLDAGSASAHRAYFPDFESLRTCIDVVKHLLEGIYILHPKVERLDALTPKRINK